jgi:hypothetical protein
MRHRESTGAEPPAARPPAPVVTGTVAVRRSHLLGFPTFELRAEKELRVGMGRYSALNIYFGIGQKIVLPSGERWRLTAIEQGSGLRPVVATREHRRLAMASAGVGNYGINGRDWAYTLNPAEAGWGRASRWDLFVGDEPAARFTRRPLEAVCEHAVPLPALLLALLLTRMGIPGEGDMHVPELRWG